VSDASIARTARPADDSIPEGWVLGSESWSFHRQFFTRVGRPTAYREYTDLILQVRYGRAERLDRYRYRVTMLDGAKLIVSGGWKRLSGVEHPDWTAPKPKQPPAVAIRPPEPAVPTPPPESAPNTAPRRPTTLTLGNPAAARALSERLRRIGVPAHAPSGASAQ
jgi:hypothetical protein